MKGPDIFVFIFSVLYLIGIYSGYRDRNKGGLQILFWCTISLIVYIIGITHFYDEVRRASTHGNTIHGWYSKSNGAEKVMAGFWAIGFPIITNGLLLLYIYYRPEKNKNFNEQKTNISKKIVQKPVDKPFDWWNKLDDKWKKILNYHIDNLPKEFWNSYNFNRTPKNFESLAKEYEPTNEQIDEILKLQEIEILCNGINSIEPLKPLIDIIQIDTNQNYINLKEFEFFKKLKNASVWLNNENVITLNQSILLNSLEVLKITTNKCDLELIKFSSIDKLKEFSIYENHSIGNFDLKNLENGFNIEKITLWSFNLKNIKAIHNLTKLKKIEVPFWNSSFSKNDLENFKIALPNCEIICR